MGLFSMALPQLKGVRQYLDILFAFLKGRYQVTDFAALLSHGPVVVKLSISADGNTVNVDFIDPMPVIEVKKILKLESSVLGATITQNHITARLKGMPDITVDVVS